MRRYCREDFKRIRDFLVNTYTYFQRPYNWTIERWNFSISLARIMHGVTLQMWESQIAIWEHDREIVAVVNTEGEDEGEVFFQMAHEQISHDILHEMFTFCENHLGKEEDGKRVIKLRIPLGNHRVEEIALGRNYAQLPGIEQFTELHLQQELPVQIAEGFSFKRGDLVSDVDKGEAHARAFGYVEETVYRERSPIGYQAMSETPDYRPDLDLYVLSKDHEIAAFATMWYDQQNRIGILEPVGTIPQYRRMGLGRACIMQLANQVRQEDGLKIYVGSTQDFYQRLGFQAIGVYSVWVKEVRL